MSQLQRLRMRKRREQSFRRTVGEVARCLLALKQGIVGSSPARETWTLPLRMSANCMRKQIDEHLFNPELLGVVLVCNPHLCDLDFLAKMLALTAALSCFDFSGGIIDCLFALILMLLLLLLQRWKNETREEEKKLKRLDRKEMPIDYVGKYSALGRCSKQTGIPTIMMNWAW